MVIEVVSSPHNLRPLANVGAPRPLHRGAAGKVLLAWLPRVEREALAAASMTLFDSDQSLDPRRLHAELEQVCAAGWAASDGERVSGVSALAAPVFDAAGRVAGALTLVAPSARFSDEQRTRYIPLICEATRPTSRYLGHREIH